MKEPVTNWTVSADLPTPPDPKTTTLYSLMALGGRRGRGRKKTDTSFFRDEACSVSHPLTSPDVFKPSRLGRLPSRYYSTRIPRRRFFPACSATAAGLRSEQNGRSWTSAWRIKAHFDRTVLCNCAWKRERCSALAWRFLPTSSARQKPKLSSVFLKEPSHPDRAVTWPRRRCRRVRVCATSALPVHTHCNYQETRGSHTAQCPCNYD